MTEERQNKREKREVIETEGRRVKKGMREERENLTLTASAAVTCQ